MFICRSAEGRGTWLEKGCEPLPYVSIYGTTKIGVVRLSP